MNLLTNKRIIVTGATMGIGQAVAIRAAQEGADVAFCGLSEVGADDTMRAIAAAGRRAFFRALDLRDLDAARCFAREAIAFLGGLDGLVNNAGANTWHGVLNATFEDLENCFRVNFYHAWALSQEAYPALKAAGGGVIVNLSSINAERTMPGVFPYNTAKAMLVALTKSIAIEWGKDNIRAVAIQPGLILTGLAFEYFDKSTDPQAERRRAEGIYPLKRAGRPEEVAATIVHILSGENSFLNGAAILIDGGISALYETTLED
jgi:NAD(P)-dependent dehydrogenase (short-subunit alcohol dehydrogenase family)